MKTDKSWWSRHLGNPAPAPVQQPQGYQQPVYPQQQQAPIQPQQFQQQVPQPQQMPQVTPDNMKEAMNHWRGGEATMTETQRCPACGSNHYFSRSQGSKRGPAPSPQCFDCGYNELFSQADPTNYQ